MLLDSRRRRKPFAVTPSIPSFPLSREHLLFCHTADTAFSVIPRLDRGIQGASYSSGSRGQAAGWQ